VETLTSPKRLGCGPTGYTIELTVKVKNMGAAAAIKPASGAYWAGIGGNEAGPWPKGAGAAEIRAG
jgi:hypothetical protein